MKSKLNLKIDKRSLKTRTKIKLALMVLLKSKELSEISIKEITEMAGVNRNSFYTHYNNVNEVVSDMNESVLCRFNELAKKYTYEEFINDPYPLMSEITLELLSNSAFSEYVMFSKNSSEFVHNLINSFTDRIYEIYMNARGDTNPYMPYMISFLVAGTIEFYFKWFRSDKSLKIEDVTFNVSKIIKDGISMVRNVKKETLKNN